MNQLALVVLALFGQMERIYAAERSAHALPCQRGGHGARARRRSAVRGRSRQARTCNTLGGQRHLHGGHSLQNGPSRATLYRHLLARSPKP